MSTDQDKEARNRALQANNEWLEQRLFEMFPGRTDQVGRIITLFAEYQTRQNKVAEAAVALIEMEYAERRAESARQHATDMAELDRQKPPARKRRSG